MNLYDLHTHPTSLHGYDRADMEVPAVFWERYKKNPAELKKREAALAKDPYFAYMYAENTLKGRFPEGEAAIAKVAGWACLYAVNVLHGPFPAGEAAIYQNKEFSKMYALLMTEVKHNGR